jgi:Flp pilus assembly protein TadD
MTGTVNQGEPAGLRRVRLRVAASLGLGVAVSLWCVVNVLATQLPAAPSDPRGHAEAIRHLRLGQENLRAEQWDKAEIEFKAAVKLEPTLEMAHYGLGQVYMNTRRFPAAVAAYLACRDAFTTNISRLAANDMQAQRALDDEIRNLEDERALLASGRVRSSVSGGPAALDQRINDLRQRRFRDPKTATVTPTWISLALGSAYFRSGSLPDAEREYRATLAVDPKLGEAHNNLAVVCLLTGRLDEADVEIRMAEKAGFRVNPQLKEDVKKARARP